MYEYFIIVHDALHKFFSYQVTNIGKDERFCEECVAIPPNSKIHSSYDSKEIETNIDNARCSVTQKHDINYANVNDAMTNDIYEPNTCAGCRQQLKEGQALIALDRQWHISCFR